MTKNRLQFAKSPYLLQHADNPVHWFEWGEEAFKKADEENKPVFLSIGYSTCHWCHVMEHESFENQEVASLLNEGFISIKVDREERPDIDNFYMTVCQMMNSNCGWPLSVFMTPDKKPFFVSTYIPRNGMYGRPGMMELLPELLRFWQTRRDEIDNSTDKILNQLAFTSAPHPGEINEEELLNQAYSELRHSFDSTYGGFGSRPKFPIPHNLTFLMQHYLRTGKKEALNMVTLTLEKMHKGGVYDHLGYGFHRYSTDARWFLPHFEKMLYDQAGLMQAYAQASTITGNDRFARTAKEIFRYAKRNLLHPDGAFYSAEDADSEGIEGKFYVWSYDELSKLLDADLLDLFTRVYNIRKEGNFHDEATGEETGLNIPFLIKSLEEYSSASGKPLGQLQADIESTRQILFAEREKRIKPGLDDKILTDWNGQFIAALARSAKLLNDDEMLEAARKAMDFIFKKMRQDDSRLLHRFRAGEAGIDAFLDDYAFVIEALIQLYRCDYQFDYLAAAAELMEIALEDFLDQHGAFYFTSARSKELLVRKKEFYDGASPSGNSVMLDNLITLARYTGNAKWEDIAQKMLDQYAGLIERQPSVYTRMMTALEKLIGQKEQLVIAGEMGPEMQEALSNLQPLFDDEIILVKTAANSQLLGKLAPFTRDMSQTGKEPTYYLCRGNACQSPTNNLSQILENLS